MAIAVGRRQTSGSDGRSRATSASTLGSSGARPAGLTVAERWADFSGKIRAFAIARSSPEQRRRRRRGPEMTGAAPATDQDERSDRADTPRRVRDQMIVRVLRIACRTIAVSLREMPIHLSLAG